MDGYKALNGAGFERVDFKADENGKNLMKDKCCRVCGAKYYTDEELSEEGKN